MSVQLKVVSRLIFAFGLLTLAGCEEDQANDLAKAQKCLDGITSANYATADSCFEYVSRYDSQQANILKCSIKFVAGGLTTEKVALAYKKIAENGMASKEATFMTILALNPPNKATEAQGYCVTTGLKGLIYLANLAVMGSNMAQMITGIGTTGHYDPADPSSFPSPAEINEVLNNCKPPATCGGNFATIGQATLNIADSYCSGSNASTDVCTKINDAVQSSGGDPTLVAKQLFCVLDGKTYDSMSGSCL